MGAWGTGPFDNDDAADFAVSLDHLEPEQRAGAIRDILVKVVDESNYLERDAGGAAVAAAALVAAQQSDDITIDCIHGPKQSIPKLAEDLRPVAVLALSRVLADCSELNELWLDSPVGDAWLHMIAHLADVLGKE
jgi:hypothetical protein